MIFSPSPSKSYIQYELDSSKRTFAQLIGAGLTTTNLTSPLELPCLINPTVDEIASGHHYDATSWHQATPSLKLILCVRANQTCLSKDGGPNVVFFAAVQRKHLNGYGLPARYERYFVLWSAESPFNMLAISSHPIIFFNETARGWSDEETWDDVSSVPASSSSTLSSSFSPRDVYNEDMKRSEFGTFTYTTTISYAWGREETDIREKGTGYLDDDVIVSVGIDDRDGLYGRASVRELLGCLRICPGK